MRKIALTGGQVVIDLMISPEDRMAVVELS